MDYLYENLGPERFQEFCSSLIANEFPDFQSFPVGQRDGGRDSIGYFMQTTKKEFIVFQVKFVRNPKKIQDVHQWLTGIIQAEAPKMNRLIPNGAKKFYLLTNVAGTAYLDSGSINKVNSILEKEMSIPSLCWWRDDLSRKLESNPLFKWSFPEVLNGQDILNSALFQNLNENRERREDTIKAYLADQYDIDSEVKFKQIELQNKLFDLFTDVPIRIKKINERNKYYKKHTFLIKKYMELNPYERHLFEDNNHLGAAAFLLDSRIQNNIERVLLEAGPGQGKSTISQYVCQVHRAKLLNRVSDLKLLPEHLKKSSIRLPLKIDLRDIASWVEKKNPYQIEFNDKFFKTIWKNSLESFLVAHIIYHSKMDKFSSNDFAAILRVSSVLLVFDGFDEIANLKVRGEVIEFINKGINRISEYTKSIQVLVTSRPAVFSDSVGFSDDLYPHFELGEITPSIIREYVDKWIKASRLDSREAVNIKKLVNEKLEMPHLKDLTKSPMQLAIFISLLRTRGESLPNKRTALYDSYIELFFNRESEKNILIRENRELIIDIHQYLAWILHSEAELLKNSGRIRIEDLKNRLKDYLEYEGHKTDIGDKLFDVMKERVCALVSRVQGTFEFEVQPLREYFCARYLYNTSPYSPSGYEKKGTKPERFEAIAKNFYWNNVVRFFTGCFDRGELPMLIYKLEELQEDEFLKYTNYPRLLTSQILSDWVFTQYPKLLKNVVKIIVDGVNIGSILNQESGRYYNDEPILLPNECGRKELVSECFEQLKTFPLSDYAHELISIIKNNPYNNLISWEKYAEQIEGKKLTIWFIYGYWLEVIYKADNKLLTRLIKKGNLNSVINKIQVAINGNKIDVINKDSELKQKALIGVTSGKLSVINLKEINRSSLQLLSIVWNPFLLSRIFESGLPNISLKEFILDVIDGNRSLYRAKNHAYKFMEFPIQDSIDKNIRNFYQSIKNGLEIELSNWINSIEPWDILVENSIVYFKDAWSVVLVSIIAAGIKARSAKYEDFQNLEDSTISLCKRVRCARMKSGNTKYWKRIIKKAKNLKFCLSVFFAWATPRTIISLFDDLNKIVYKLEEDEYLNLIESLKKVCKVSKFRQKQQVEMEKGIELNNFSDKLLLCISYRFSEDSRYSIIYKNTNVLSNNPVYITEISFQHLIKKYLKNTNNENILRELKKLYSYLNTNEEFYRHKRIKIHNHNHYLYRLQPVKIPINIAKKIMQEPKKYPKIIASMAERTCRIHANKNVKAVGEIVKNEKWFE